MHHPYSADRVKHMSRPPGKTHVFSAHHAEFHSGFLAPLDSKGNSGHLVHAHLLVYWWSLFIFIQNCQPAWRAEHVILSRYYPRTNIVMELHAENHHHGETQITPPTQKDNLSIPIAIVLAGVLVAGAIIFSDRTTTAGGGVGNVPSRNQVGADDTDIPTELLALRENEHILGNPNADVLIIEYSDTECPFCKRFHQTMVELMDAYGKDGRVAWVYRHFPLDQLHPKARKEAEALECANEIGGNAAFWRYADKLFEITPGNNGLDPAELPKIAESVGLDVMKWTACLNSGRYAERVNRDFENGANVGVHATPFSVAWNRKTGKQVKINGAYPLTQVKSMVGMVLGTVETNTP